MRSGGVEKPARCEPPEAREVRKLLDWMPRATESEPWAGQGVFIVRSSGCCRQTTITLHPSWTPFHFYFCGAQWILVIYT